MEITAELDVASVMSAERKGVPKYYFLVYGAITNDIRKKFRDGYMVYTSPVCALDRENNLVITHYSVYKVSPLDMVMIEKKVQEGGFKFFPRPDLK